MNKDKVSIVAISLSKHFSSFTWLCQSIFPSTMQTKRRYCTRTCQREITFHTALHYNKHRRINKLDIKIKEDNKSNKEFQEYIVIAVDSTGIKITNRGQWMRDKWKAGKKGYLKIHIAVSVKTKKILSMKVTDEHVHDSKMLPELVQNVIDSSSATASKLFADGGAYDSNGVFGCLADNGILPCIKVRKNSKVRWKKGNTLRNLSVLAQKNDLQKWKDSIVSCGQMDCRNRVLLHKENVW